MLRRFSYWNLHMAEGSAAGVPATHNGAVVGARALPFRRRFTREDILLVAETDSLHGTLSEPVMMAQLRYSFKVFGDAHYERLAGTFPGNLHNPRHSKAFMRVLGSRDVSPLSGMSVCAPSLASRQNAPPPNFTRGYNRPVPASHPSASLQAHSRTGMNWGCGLATVMIHLDSELHRYHVTTMLDNMLQGKHDQLTGWYPPKCMTNLSGETEGLTVRH